MRTWTMHVVLTTALLGAFLLIAARVLFSLAPLYQNEIEAWLSHALGQEMSIGQLEAQWWGWRPVLRLHDVNLLSETGAVQLYLQEIQVEADPVRFLTGGRIQLGEVRLVGAKISLVRHLNGRLTLTGLERFQGTDTAPALPAWLVSVRRVAVVRSEVWWIDRRPDHSDLRLKGLNLALHSDGYRHWFKGSVKLPTMLGERLEIAADFRGPWTVSEEWVGEVYLQGVGVRARGFAQRTSLPGITVLDGRGEVRLWASLERGHLERLVGRFALTDVWLVPKATNSDSAVRPVALPELQASLHWHSYPQGWTLDLLPLQLRIDRNDRLKTWVHVRGLQDEQGRETLSVGIPRVQMRPVSRLLQRLVLGAAEKNQWLRELELTGTVNNLWLEWRPQTKNLAYRARVRNLTIQEHRRLPGVRSLSGTVLGDLRSGRLLLDNKPFQMMAAQLFAQPLSIDSIAGSFQWEKVSETWRVSTPDLWIANQDIRVQLRLAVDFTPDQPKPLLDFQAYFEGGEVARAMSYVPIRLFKGKIRTWLQDAFSQGRVVSGEALFYGPISSFPFREHNGVFAIRFDVTAASLHYQSGWPDLREVDAKVWFRNASLTIEADRGRILATQIRHAKATIPDLARAVLTVGGTVTGDLHGMQRFLDEIPIRDRFQVLLEQFVWHGSGTLQLNLEFPIRSKIRPDLSGYLQVRNARLLYKVLGLELTKMRGSLRFSETGLKTGSIDARFLDVPIEGRLEPSRSTSQVSIPRTRAIFTGRFATEILAKEFPSRLWRYLAGATDLSLSIDWSPSPSSPVNLELFSDLVGTAVNAPEPLYKQASQARPLRVAASVSSDTLSTVKISYAPAMQVRLVIGAASEDYAPRSVVVAMGEAVWGLKGADVPGLYIRGHLERFELSPWLRFGNGEEERLLSEMPLTHIDVTMDQFDLFGQVFTAAHLRLQRSGLFLVGDLQSREAEGTLRIPVQGERTVPLNLDFKRLQLAWPRRDEARDTYSIDPRQFHPIQLHVENFSVAGTRLGGLRMVSELIPQGQRLQTLELKSRAFSAHVEGTWVIENGRSRCGLEANLHGDSLGKVLKELGFVSSVKGGKTTLDMQLEWPGSVTDFSVRRLAGLLHLVVKKGRFLEVEPGVGRVFGLLNFETLLRRLSLDFTDLFQKGYSFDQIEGHFILSEGRAQIDELVMEAPSSRLQVKGITDLVNRTYDQTVTVIPKLTATLPIAGAIAGGPAVGGVLLLAQKLFGNKIDKITRFEYSISGPWDSPEIQPLEGGVLSPITRMLGSGDSDGEGDAESEQQSDKALQHWD